MPSPIASLTSTVLGQRVRKNGERPRPIQMTVLVSMWGMPPSPWIFIKDWMWILNYVRRRPNWAVNVYRGYVILVIFGHTVRGMYTIRDVAIPNDDGESLMHQSFIGICASSFGSYVGSLGDDHINSPSIISSGESKESATLCHVAVEEDLILLGGTQTCKELLCDQHIMDSNTTSDGI